MTQFIQFVLHVERVYVKSAPVYLVRSVFSLYLTTWFIDN